MWDYMSPEAGGAVPLPACGVGGDGVSISRSFSLGEYVPNKTTLGKGEEVEELAHGKDGG